MSSPTHPGHSSGLSDRAGLRQWLGLVTLVLPVILIGVDMTVLGFAVPSLSTELDPTGEQLLWIVDVYGFFIAGFLITMGTLGDRFGRRRVLLIGSAAFGAASALAAFSTGPEMLIASRALLGVAGATLMPSTLSLLRSMFPNPRQRVVAVAVWASGFSVGTAVGPVVGGALLQHFWWGSVFLINVPISVLILVSVSVLVDESRDPRPGPIDLASVAMSLAGMLLAVFGVKKLASGEIEALPAAALVAGVLALGLFVRRQRRLAHPLLDLTLFRIPQFRAGVTANFMLIFSIVSSIFFLTQLLQLAYGMSPLAASVVLVPGIVVSIAAGFVIIPVARRFSLRSVITSGLTIVAAGFTMMAFAPGTDGAVFVAVAFTLVALGTGMSETLTNDAILTAAPPARAGAASAISETAYELGGALGVAVLGSVLGATYSRIVAGTDIPGVTEARLDAAAQTLGAAREVNDALGGAAGAALWDVAREAFVASVHLTGAAAAAITLAAAATVWWQLRDERSHRRESRG